MNTVLCFLVMTPSRSLGVSWGYMSSSSWAVRKNTSRHRSVSKLENCHFSSSKVPQMALTIRRTVSFK